MTHLHNQEFSITTLSKRYFCWGGQKTPTPAPTPAVTPPPKPDPLPSPTPTKVDSRVTAEDRRRRISRLRRGRLSTIKTGPQGLSSDDTVGKTKLGE